MEKRKDKWKENVPREIQALHRETFLVDPTRTQVSQLNVSSDNSSSFDHKPVLNRVYVGERIFRDTKRSFRVSRCSPRPMRRFLLLYANYFRRLNDLWNYISFKNHSLPCSLIEVSWCISNTPMTKRNNRIRTSLGVKINSVHCDGNTLGFYGKLRKYDTQIFVYNAKSHRVCGIYVFLDV